MNRFLDFCDMANDWRLPELNPMKSLALELRRKTSDAVTGKQKAKQPDPIDEIKKQAIQSTSDLFRRQLDIARQADQARMGQLPQWPPLGLGGLRGPFGL